MKKLIGAFLLCAPALAHAEAYVCTPQAISGVANVDGRYISTEVNIEGATFYTAQEEGRWYVKAAGYDSPLVSACQSSTYCKSEAGWFTRDAANGTFVAQWNNEVSRSGGTKVVGYLVGGGICQRL